MAWPVYIDENLCKSRVAPDNWAKQLRAAGGPHRHAAAGAVIRYGDDAAGMAKALVAEKVAILAFRLRIDVRAPDDATRLQTAADTIAQYRAMLALELTSSDKHDRASSPRALPVAAAAVRQVLTAAMARKMPVSLFPAADAWMARSQDAVAVAMRVNHPSLGVAARLTLDDAASPQSLDAQLRLVGPRLNNVIVDATTLIVDAHATTVRAWRAALGRMGYRGAVTLDGGQATDSKADIASLITRWEG